MFTGIIEAMGEIVKRTEAGTNLQLEIKSPLSNSLKIDQSVAHNGVCLTVVACNEQTHTVTAIKETIDKTTVGNWSVGNKINLERCMPANGRFDGHIVQGHVDQTAVCIDKQDEGGSWRFRFEYAASENITVEKGSICVNGVSLTVVDAAENAFSVAIIPYTFEHTQFHRLQPGEQVNLEFDIVGKYMQRLLEKYRHG
jgi:riboflavin synthase